MILKNIRLKSLADKYAEQAEVAEKAKKDTTTPKEKVVKEKKTK